jgi:murein DD-endopeptidase MepM/ murein hydrolase activator NlpD
VPENQQCKYDDSIIEHEKIHAILLHTIDLILTETFIALLWFHPFVFFFRKSIKTVHEYQVDSRILKSNVQKSYYLSLMLKHLELNHRMIGLYNYFNGITIKNRVKMITKNKSRKFQLLRYLVLIPVITLLAMSFTKTVGEKPEILPISKDKYSKITVQHGEKIMNPFTKKEVVHKGIDIKANEGIPVMSTAKGIILKVTTEKGWGNLVVFDHGSGYTTWYAHLKDFSVKTGQEVSKGQTIGHVGNTGYSTAPHLHYEVRLNNKSVDPMDYIE